MRRFILTAFALVWMASRAGAVDFGWQTISSGGIEYIVQVEPGLIDSFRKEGFSSEVPAGLRDIRRIRIEVGSDRLPNQGNLSGPTVAQTAPPATELKDENQNSHPAGQETFGQGSKAAAESAQTAGAPPLLDPSRAVPPLPFFQSGAAKSISPKAENSAQSEQESVEQNPRASTIPTSGATASKANQIGKPGLKSNEGPAFAAGERNASERRTIEAGMATAPSTGENEGGRNQSSRGAPSKPWAVLVLALLILFASLGANVYLAWIHQGVRAKYHVLVVQLHGGGAG